MNVSDYLTMRYANLNAGSSQKTKPIQTQFKANLSQNKPNLTQNKPNSKPIQTQFQIQKNAGLCLPFLDEGLII
ncbi:MAG: hypothetical protein ISS76_11915 [Phycisphaerae bacterium]|nr:hypothetical protein [Phycisphaerae bacterium]